MSEWPSDFETAHEADEYERVVCDNCREQPQLVWNISMRMPELRCDCGLWDCGDYGFPEPWSGDTDD